MTQRLTGYLRTAVTLAVLSLILIYGVTRGLDAVSEPFPERVEPPLCVDSAVDRGDVIRPGEVTVSVVNAGTRTGLASTTRADLEAREFARGELENIPDPDVRSAQIWAPDGRSPAVRLVRSYLGGKVQIVQRDSGIDGITVVVGDRFPGVQKGMRQVKVFKPSTVCGPAALN